MWQWIYALLFAAATILPAPAHGEYADVVLNRFAEQEGMRPVIFPHWFHRLRFTCNVCHSEIFKMRAGSNNVTMAEIIEGRFCGKCHNNQIAWGPEHCHRCHSGLSNLEGGFYNGHAAGGPAGGLRRR